VWVITASALAVPLVAARLWRPGVALPVLLVAVAVAVRAAVAVPAVRGPRWAALAVVLIALGAGLWAAATHAEHVVLRRDAGTYALYAHHLATQHGLPVDVDVPALGGPAAVDLPAVTVGSPGFFEQGSGAETHVVPQFLPATPVVLSLGWWARGWGGLLVAPAVALAAALLAFAALARSLVGPAWAVAATAALAVTQPVLHAGRSTYSEPLALLVGCAALCLLVVAGRLEDGPGKGVQSRVRTAWLGLAAGLLLGGAGLVRVDALREAALLVPVAALLIWRGSAVGRPLLAGLGAGVLYAAGAALLLSRPYLGAIAGSLLPLVALVLVLAGGSWLALRLARSPGGRLRWPAAVLRRAPWLLASAVLVGFVALASRPLWLVVRQSAADPGARVVAGLQQAQGLPVDGGRTYGEASVGWTAWWVGVPVLVLALAAAAWLAYRLGGVLTQGQQLPRWLAPAAVGVAATALILYRPAITPDHPWADRRLVPVVLPTVVLLATAAVAYLTRRLRVARGHDAARVAAGVGVVLLTVPALMATAPVAGQRTERGQVAAVRTACAAFGPLDTAVLVDSRAANEWPQVLRGVCRVPSLVVRQRERRPDVEAVQAVSRAITVAGRRPILVSATSADALVQLGATPRQVVSVATTEDQRLLTRRPDGAASLRVDLWTGPVPSTSP
jgi:hypothetical protein